MKWWLRTKLRPKVAVCAAAAALYLVFLYPFGFLLDVIDPGAEVEGRSFFMLFLGILGAPLAMAVALRVRSVIARDEPRMADVGRMSEWRRLERRCVMAAVTATLAAVVFGILAMFCAMRQGYGWLCSGAGWWIVGIGIILVAVAAGVISARAAWQIRELKSANRAASP